MPTKIQLLFELSAADIEIKVANRKGPILTQQSSCLKTRLIDFKTSMPEQLIFTLEDLCPGHFVKVLEMTLGTIKLSDQVLGQIFTYYPEEHDQTVTTFWDKKGKITVDLFSEDWVQYHLIYKNKIEI